MGHCISADNPVSARHPTCMGDFRVDISSFLRAKINGCELNLAAVQKVHYCLLCIPISGRARLDSNLRHPTVASAYRIRPRISPVREVLRFRINETLSVIFGPMLVYTFTSLNRVRSISPPFDTTANSRCLGLLFPSRWRCFQS